MDPITAFVAYCAGQLPNSNLSVRLWTDRYSPGPLLPFNFTLATFPGYRHANGDAWAQKGAIPGGALAVSGLLTWVASGVQASQVVKGLIIVLTYSGYDNVMAVHTFAAPVDMSQEGSRLSLFAAYQGFILKAIPPG